jgi:stress-induced morphogen
METVMKRIQKALQKEFSPKGILLEDAGEGFVGGWIISKSFEGLDGMQRQKKVRNLFDKYLDEKDRTRLAVFLTFTPLEKKAIFDDDFNTFKASSKKKSLSVRRTTTAGHKNSRVGQKRRLARNGRVAKTR